MIEKVKKYFGTLAGLSTEELDRSTEKLVRAEKRNVALVIAHIAELSRRKGFLELGYKNLFDYCVRRLCLSEGSVALRIQVANVSKHFPQILVALAENRLSLTVAGLLAPLLTDDNVEKLLGDCAGMTKREAEEYLVSLRPKECFKPSIRKTPTPPPPEPLPVLTARPEVFNFRFSADRKFKEKFERLAEVLGVGNSQQHMAEIMEQALDIALDKKDVKRKRERRLQRVSKSNKSRLDEVLPRSRYIPSEVRERVQDRAGYQCEFRGRDGTRCRQRTGLQIEHLRDYALGGSHDERNLRLHCGPHNRLTAERRFGAAFIQGKIDASRRKHSSP